jgi:FkbM family methyltransferase
MMSDQLIRFVRFAKRPSSEKREILAWYRTYLWDRIRRIIPVIKRMEPGFLFVVRDDAVRGAVLSGEFERFERQFVRRYLKKGMTVLDVGAYFGIYALTASVQVGPQGHVVAFEPSARQMRGLRFNLFVNRCSNVRTEKLALSNVAGPAKFFVATDGAEGFSGLRRPEVDAAVRSVDVKTAILDDYLKQHAISTVDLIKVDVEGGELDFFRGARKLLGQSDSPVILCELQDIRSRSWGHTARQTADFVREFGYRWFRPLPGGRIAAMSDNPEAYEGNFIAVPPRRIESIKEMIKDGPAVPH